MYKWVLKKTGLKIDFLYKMNTNLKKQISKTAPSFCKIHIWT